MKFYATNQTKRRKNIFIDPIVSARKKAEKRDLFISISLLRLFSRAHYWSNKYILKMRVSSKELFSTLKKRRKGNAKRRKTGKKNTNISAELKLKPGTLS